MKIKKIDIAFHGTKTRNVPSIVEHNLVVPGSEAGTKKITVTHGSCFGKGIYLSPSIEKSSSYGSTVFVCLVLRGVVRLVSDVDSSMRSSSSSFDSSVSPDGNEFVFYDSDQILPCYLLTLADQIDDSTKATLNMAAINTRKARKMSTPIKMTDKKKDQKNQTFGKGW